MELQEFIDALYAAGWNAPCDAQHENIENVYNEVRIKAAKIAYDLGVKAGLAEAAALKAATATRAEALKAARDLYKRGERIPAVKLYRQHTGCSLKEAFDAVTGEAAND